jgi:hypothetical protein
MFGLLNRQAMLDAAHDLYTVSYQWAEEEAGLPASDWRDVPRLTDDVQLPIIAFYLGRVHQAWGYDPGLVFHHMGLRHDDVQGQALAIYRLLMGCLGHGLSLADDHGEWLDRASEVLLNLTGGAFDPVPFQFEGSEWEELAREEVQKRYVEFYREPNGDFLCIWAVNGRNPDGTWSGRATAIEGIASSVCTTGISDEYLATCERVDREAVPAEWLRHIGE